MSKELKNFSELIDEQFDIDMDIELDGFWQNILNLFI